MKTKIYTKIPIKGYLTQENFDEDLNKILKVFGTSILSKSGSENDRKYCIYSKTLNTHLLLYKYINLLYFWDESSSVYLDLNDLFFNTCILINENIIYLFKFGDNNAPVFDNRDYDHIFRTASAASFIAKINDKNYLSKNNRLFELQDFLLYNSIVGYNVAIQKQEKNLENYLYGTHHIQFENKIITQKLYGYDFTKGVFLENESTDKILQIIGICDLQEGTIVDINDRKYYCAQKRLLIDVTDGYEIYDDKDFINKYNEVNKE